MSAGNRVQPPKTCSICGRSITWRTYGKAIHGREDLA